METPTLQPRHNTLREIPLAEILPSENNPRVLFDKDPLQDLEDSIKLHNVLVPITVYWDEGLGHFRIIDGERRYRCCRALTEAGVPDRNAIPANVVDPPDPLSRVLYMFVIHKHREDWELMPTALSLQDVMRELGEEGADNKRLKELTGLGEMQIERCRILLSFPKRFQDMSLEEELSNRMPANFWIEAFPLLNEIDRAMPNLNTKYGGRDGVTDRLVEKYSAGAIRSVIHFRRIMDALTLPLTRDTTDEQQAGVLEARTAVASWLENVHLETKTVFDPLFRDDKRVVRALELCATFRTKLEALKIDNTLDRAELKRELTAVFDAVNRLLDKLNATDAPNLLDLAEDGS